jgi:polyketide synthase 12/polyene macrolide polyketide synthase
MEATWGIAPAAVIMLDTLSFLNRVEDGVDYPEMMRLNFANAANVPFRLTNSRLSGMGRWLGTSRVQVRPVSAPSLLIRAGKPFYEGMYTPGSADDRGPVVDTATVRVIDADHVTMIREEAATTAQIIEDWISAGRP